MSVKEYTYNSWTCFHDESEDEWVALKDDGTCLEFYASNLQECHKYIDSLGQKRQNLGQGHVKKLVLEKNGYKLFQAEFDTLEFESCGNMYFTILSDYFKLKLLKKMPAEEAVDLIQQREDQLFTHCFSCHDKVDLGDIKSTRPPICTKNELCKFRVSEFSSTILDIYEFIRTCPENAFFVEFLVYLKLASGGSSFNCLKDLDIRSGQFTNQQKDCLCQLVLGCPVHLALNLVHKVAENVLLFEFKTPDIEKEKRFASAKRDNSTHPKPIYAFHGSSIRNWYNIIQEGLHYKKVDNGRAYGDGIYHSTEFSTSSGYTGTSTNLPGFSFGTIQSIVSINEIVNCPNKFTSTNPHLVIPNIDWVQIRYLVVKTSSVPKGLVLDRLPIKHEKIELEYELSGPVTLVRPVFGVSSVSVAGANASNSARKQLLKRIQELIYIQHSIPYFKFFHDYCLEHSLFQWNFYLYLTEWIEFEIKFPDTFPNAPPFVRVIAPQIKQGTGHVTFGGAVCMELLTQSGWRPVYSLESLIIQIHSLMMTSDPKLEIESRNDGRYTLDNAKQYFNLAAQKYGWKP